MMSTQMQHVCLPSAPQRHTEKQITVKRKPFDRPMALSSLLSVAVSRPCTVSISEPKLSIKLPASFQRTPWRTLTEDKHVLLVELVVDLSAHLAENSQILRDALEAVVLLVDDDLHEMA